MEAAYKKSSWINKTNLKNVSKNNVKTIGKCIDKCAKRSQEHYVSPLLNPRQIFFAKKSGE